MGPYTFIWKGKERSFSFCPYTAFGITVFVVFISLILAFCGAMIYSNADGNGFDVWWANTLTILTACWISGFIMVNLGEPKADAATNFWVGPIFCVAVHILGFLGLGIIWLFT